MTSSSATGSMKVKRGLAEMLKGGVIMDVVTPDEAKIAEDAGATAVMALERVPADIRRDGGVARMSDPEMIEGIKAAVSIPVMAKARIGHFVEAQILEALGVDFVDESEVLTPADETHHIDKFAFTAPFVCGATNLGEALRRVSEGAALIRSKGEAGTGNVVEAVRHLRSIIGDIRKLTQADSAELFDWAKKLGAPLPLVQEVAETGWLQVPIFCAGGIATPADAALAMQLGAEAVFVGSGIFKSDNPSPRAKKRGIWGASPLGPRRSVPPCVLCANLNTQLQTRPLRSVALGPPPLHPRMRFGRKSQFSAPNAAFAERPSGTPATPSHSAFCVQISILSSKRGLCGASLWDPRRSFPQCVLCANLNTRLQTRPLRSVPLGPPPLHPE